MGYAEDNGVFKYISVARFASRTLDHELEKNTRTVVPYFSSTFILMAVFRYIILYIIYIIHIHNIFLIFYNYIA